VDAEFLLNELNEMSQRVADPEHGLTHLQQQILMKYALLGGIDGEAVLMTAADMAKRMGVSPSNFSRERRKLVAGGWVSYRYPIGSMPMYGLTAKTLGAADNVVALRA
jgi:DNA-binding MarR family transcriptional regulator